MAHNNRRTAAGTNKSAVVAVAMGFPDPPAAAKLRKHDMPFWESVVRARLPQQWVEFDLLHAANLARTLSDLEEHRKQVMSEGDMVADGKGDMKVNPRHLLIEALSKRSMALTRLLQLHAIPNLGQANKMGISKGSASDIAATLVTSHQDDDLLARPTAH